HRLRHRFPADGQCDNVGAGLDGRRNSATPPAEAGASLLVRWGIRREVPQYAVDSRTFRSVEGPERLAGRVRNRNLDVAGCGVLQVVGDRGAARRICADEHLLAADLLPVLLIVEP